MRGSNKYGELIFMLFVFIMAFLAVAIFFNFGIFGLLLKIVIILTGILCSALILSKNVRNFWDKFFINSNILEKIKDWHIRICILILMLISLMIFASGFTFNDTMQSIPCWFALLYGWSGLVVTFKLSDILYKDKK